MMSFFAPCIRLSNLGRDLEGMRTFGRLGLLALAAATIVACNSKDTVLGARDGAADQGAGGAGTGGGGGYPGTGGVSGLGGSGGTIVTGTGGGSGGANAGGTGGGLGGAGGSGTLGAGGTAKDGGDVARDAIAALDAPNSDDGANCGPGYPVGSQKPQGDGCNTCYCQGGGNWLCTSKQCLPPPEAGAEVGADAGPCPAGQMWCTGCTPGTGSCGVVCTGVACPAPDAGCEGDLCASSDAPAAQEDAADADAASCSQVTTQAECDVRGDCHSVFRSLGACGCAPAGCCMRFLACADGATATCTAPTSFGCTIATPGCDSPYVLSYTPGCYEGCVQPSECGP